MTQEVRSFFDEVQTPLRILLVISSLLFIFKYRVAEGTIVKSFTITTASFQER